ncbi:plasmid stabilization protein [Streptomyces sp. NPDC001642]|uniref:plasmid stabilization protein n=1 Tax=Streptomyces sp. NPDC001642 TaxID=3154392 RepID=UPI00332D39A5
MSAGSDPKRERQDDHIKDSAEKRAASAGHAKEFAARTVNEERAPSAEARTASRTSAHDKKSASQRGSERSHRGPVSPTGDQLYEVARTRSIHGRSAMNKRRPARAFRN